MKALIFAAGKGERMRPLTESTPKALLEVRGRALIEWRLQALARAGITEVVVNLSWLGAQIRARLGDGRAHGVRIVYSEEGPEPLETGGGMLAALPLLGGEPFLAVNADVWTDHDPATLPTAPRGLAHLVLVPNPEQHPQGDFVLAADGHCRREHPGARLTFAGIGVYRPELLATCSPGRFPLGPLLFDACRRGEVTGELFAGTWADIGTPTRLAAINEA